MSGANNGTEFPDYSPVPKTATVFGDAKTVTTKSKYYGRSGYFDGTGDYLTIPTHPDFDFGTGDFSVECWFNPAVLNTAYVFSIGAWGVYISSNGQILLWDGSVNVISSTTGNITVGVWRHLALTRSGTNVKLFVDGTQRGATATRSTNFENIGIGVAIRPASGEGSLLTGHIQDLRITKGVARYTANFTPPTQLYIPPEYIISGTVTDDAGQPAARTVRVYNRATGTLLGTATSDAVTGAYEFALTSTDMVQVVALDDDAGTDYNALIVDRVVPQ